jgi:SAM-dependent methyltransferase
MFIVSTCEVCEGNELVPVLDLGAQPLCDDLVPIGSSAEVKKYPLELLACPRCLTVHQKYQVEKKLLFPQTYHYRAAMTEDVLAGMRELVELAGRACGDLRGKAVLDVGCNDGSLLNIFKSKGAFTVGIEPTGAAKDAKGRVDYVIEDFFGASSVETYLSHHPKPDIITFTNVFAHIENLNDVIGNLRKLLKPDTCIVIENHYLGAVVERKQFDTFYHEHPRTYSLRSFEHIARKLDLAIGHVDFPNRYNGNIRVLLRKTTSAVSAKVDETDFLSAFEGITHYIRNYKIELRDRIQRLVSAHGPLSAKAFPGRASILLNYFELTEEHLRATYERSASPKVGYYVPGTRIEIRDEVEFFADSGAPVLVNLAWHISKEIHSYVRAKGYQGDIVEIYS